MARLLLSFFSTKSILLSFTTLLIIGCNDKEETDTAYFGGQIINPKSDMVYFYKNDEPLDSSKLSVNNKFLIKLNKFTEGFYRFEHGNEFQNVYMESNDSLLIRLNTWDFDESLVFSGKGAERNNFLINLFLINQKEDKSFRKFYKLKDSLFQLKIDSTLQLKNLLYSQFKSEVPENSMLFDKLVNAAINYPIYTKKEIYPHNNMKALNSKKHPEIDPSFFKFRKTIDLEDDELINFYAHQNYVKSYLTHLAYERQVLDTFKSDIDVNMMQVALENIKNKKVQNSYLYRGIWIALLDEQASKEEKNRATRLFFDHSTNEKQVEEIKNLIAVSQKLPKGIKMPELNSKNFDDKTVKLSEIIKNKNSIVYTWPSNENEIDYFTRRVNYLEKKYPQYLFVGINSAYPRHKWEKLIASKKINSSNQCILDNDVNWLDTNFPRAILIDKFGVVQNNMTHLASRGFEKKLKEVFK